MDQSNKASSDLREWSYIDGSTQRGPVTTAIVIRMVERGIISPQALMWKAGMESWMPIASVEEFKDIVALQSKMWYFVDNTGSQVGPILTRNLTEKMKNGHIDGLTLVYSDDTNGWKKMSEIQSLRQVMMRIVAEEEAMNQALNSVSGSGPNDLPDQLQVFQEDVIPAIPEEMRKKKKDVVGKKSFATDDGKRYKWDDEEQDWVEDSEPESEPGDENDSDHDSSDESSDDDKNEISRKRKFENDKRPEDQKETAKNDMKKKKRKKRVKKGPNTWIYIAGLPSDTSEEELKSHFGKVGLIAINPSDQTSRVKVYRDEFGQCKGDATICYNSPESVAMAINILDGGYLRPNYKVTVTAADFSSSAVKFSQNNASITDNNKRAKPFITTTQRKIAQSAMKQALAWNDEDDSGIANVKALRIIVLQGMFKPSDFTNDPTFGDDLEVDVASECSKFGELDKVTVFSQNPAGVVVVKFKTSFAAQECIRVMDGRFFGGNKVKCHYWDGVTNYGTDNKGMDDDVKEEERLHEFGDWLETSQENLPAELRLRVEGE